MRGFLVLTGVLAAAAGLTGCGKDETATQREKIGHVWKYETKDNQKIAYIGSTNSVATQSAPDTFAVLLLNSLDNGTTGVTVKTVGAPFYCDLSDCTVTASIDGGRAKIWQGRMTDNQDGIFIPPARKASDMVMNGKVLTVTVGLTPKTSQAFEFNVSGLEWNGKKPSAKPKV
ncbi:hypothetical protein [Rhizorhapis sp. SPR117]|uniref:hypothetical protein n=1 Tax=Rhizorhapis sp. SPR117 TaxID=2912611 RepID=UPI001F2CE22D|nr:hypothetical protein [Rhizorhapis sp. SPR117]